MILTKKRILTIGAYERDNFGDALFFEATKSLLGDSVEIVAGSILSVSSQDSFNYDVVEYRAALQKARWDVVWVVGGEVGGVNLDMAYSMSLPTKLKEKYVTMSDDDKQLVGRAFSGTSVSSPAYIPMVKDLSLGGNNSKLVIHSAGIGNLSKVIGEKIEKVTKESLVYASSVAVRDKSSQIYCEANNIPYIYGPDLVHTISIWNPKKEIVRATKRDYILFQVNDAYVKDNSTTAIAKAITAVIKKTNMDILLFPAGLASSHDSLISYASIMDELNGYIKKRVRVITERNPLELVGYIAHATLWIGTSLHGRIVASAYNTPRISLENNKVKIYAESWDSSFPFDVHLENLISECNLEIFDINSKNAQEYSINLTNLALDNFNNAKKEALL